MRLLHFLKQMPIALAGLICIVSGCTIDDVPDPGPGKSKTPTWLLKEVENTWEGDRDKEEFSYNASYKPSNLKIGTSFKHAGPFWLLYYDTLIYDHKEQLIQIGSLDSITRDIKSSIFLEYDQQGRLTRLWSTQLGANYDTRYTHSDTVVTGVTIRPNADTISKTYIYNKKGNLVKELEDTFLVRKYDAYDNHPNIYAATNLNIDVRSINFQVLFLNGGYSHLENIYPKLSANNFLAGKEYGYYQGNLYRQDPDTAKYQYNANGFVAQSERYLTRFEWTGVPYWLDVLNRNCAYIKTED